MADPTDNAAAKPSDLGMKIAYVLGLILVVIGMLNTLPSIPGLQGVMDNITGVDGFVFRRFSYEYLFPIAFVIMMATVAMNHSQWRSSVGRSPARRAFGLFMDVALVVMAVTIALSYVIEIDSICLIDTLNGSRAEMIARALQEEIEFAELIGLPVPTSVDDPSCVTNLGVWIFLAVGLAVTVFLAYNVYVWGLPLVAVAILVAGYTMLTIAIWYFYGSEDMNRYWVTILGGEPRQLIDGRPNVEDILVNTAQGLLGRFMSILLNTVFPYIVLGSLFGVSAGGKSLIKMSFILTRRLRGGPAHAAIVSSALFGTISGGPVVNVLSTGVLTIPMMLKRGFDRVFAGGVEAAASSGGQIMPPVMGVAAFVLATMTAVPYSQVIIAAILPAVAYFGALFVTVVFQARKQGIEAQGVLPPDMKLTRLDLLHLVMIFVPIIMILFLLVTPKEAIGCGPITDFFGAVTIETAAGCRVESLPWFFGVVQNSAGDAGSAGWWAAAVLMVLFFLDKEIRQKPGKLIDALADAGILVSTLYLMFLAVSVIDFCLNLTGLSSYIARDVTFMLNSFGGAIGENGIFLFVALLAAMVLAILLGMGMPTVPAYLNVALLMGPLLTGLGISTFTAHMFVFYFAVASAITPPVAIAAFAAASITKADPMMTGFSAVRSGIVMFVIPFIFAFYPELLLIEAAQLVPGTTSDYLAGYDGTVDWLALSWLCARLALALYLIGSVLAVFDFKPLGSSEIAVRLFAALLLVMAWPLVYGAGLALTLAILVLHHRAVRVIPA